ncbi:MAG: hypothetical protein EXR49_09040 [Dehalococcoidia bacterium]|nr:hypothetical protein [Dehalococcoidia bacterium]
MQATAKVFIAKPREAVWLYVSDIRKWDEWVTGCTDTKQTSPGAWGMGATTSNMYTYGKKKFDITYKVTAYDPPGLQSVESTSGPWPFRGTVRLEPAGDGTRVYNTINAGSDSLATRVIFVAMYPLVKVMMRQRLMKELRELKAKVESR